MLLMESQTVLEVPSLYVRVYRQILMAQMQRHRSLTTREGVSRRAETAARTASSLTTREGVSAGATGTQWGGGFPHYT